MQIQIQHCCILVHNPSGMEKWENLKIPLADIERATDCFRKEIGRGGYGWVYEGELSFNGKRMKIAVKKLNKNHGQGLKEFLTEVDLLSGQRHENIVTLVGYCDEEDEKIIVYEYAEHGSLDRYIWCSNTTRHTLSWFERLKIVVDAARGLDHLHNHLQNNHVIIHRDIKSSNILLDHKWVAKISDFGLAKSTFCGFDRTTVISHACGTMGYLEPEYIRSGIVSKKSDVYSFGMVLFEVLCGRSCAIRDKDGILLLADIAKEHYDNNKLDMLIDPYLLEQMSQNALSRFSAIAYKCLLGREHRPSIDVVKNELEETLKFEMQRDEIQRLKSISISCEEGITSNEYLKKKLRRQYRHLESINLLLAEHKVQEAIEAIEAIDAIEAIEADERKHPLSNESSSFESTYQRQISLLETQLIAMMEQTLFNAADLKKVVNGLLKLEKGPLAHQLFLKAKGAHLQHNINVFLPSSSSYPDTFSPTLSNLILSAISSATKEMCLMFGDDLVNSNTTVEWAERQIETFVRLVKENAPSSETVSALHAACICFQVSLHECFALESHGPKLSKALLVLLQPYIEEVLELNFKRARKNVLEYSGNDEIMPLSPRLVIPLSTFAICSNGLLVDRGTRFIFMVKDIVDQLTRPVIFHFGENILNRILQLFNQYMDELIKALPEPSEDDSLVELKEGVPFRAETDSQQLALLGTAFTIAHELLPMVMSKIWSVQNEIKEAARKGVDHKVTPLMNNMIDYKEWRKLLQRSLDELRDHFCRQYVTKFIYSRDGIILLHAHMYLSGETDDLNCNSEPLPSLPFQALFAKLQQLSTVAGDVLHGKEKLQKVLFSRLTETVVMWLMSNEEDFWNVLENQASKLQPQGLQQLILDMHFTVELASFAGYPSRNLHQMASSIIARAIRTFSLSDRGPNQQSVLPKDEWFVESAKAAISKLLIGVDDGSDTSEIDEDHIILHDDDDDLHDKVISVSNQSPSFLSTSSTSESFASAEIQMLDDLSSFTDP